MLGRVSKDFDFVVEGGDQDYRKARAYLIGLYPPVKEPEDFPQFRTCRWTARDGSRLDLARPRTETYRAPGALPVVSPAATVLEDLGRRDFSINAVALGVSKPVKNSWIDPFAGRRDAAGQLIRVLHERSFEDDPTRMLRALRYRARLGFHFHPETSRLFRQAQDGRRLETITWPRKRDELLKAFAEDARSWGPVLNLFVQEGFDFGFLPRRISPGLAAKLKTAGAQERLIAVYGEFLAGDSPALNLYHQEEPPMPLSSLSWPDHGLTLALKQAEDLFGRRWRLSNKAHPLLTSALRLTRPHWAKAVARDCPAYLNGRDLAAAGVDPAERNALLSKLFYLSLSGKIKSRTQAMRWIFSRSEA